MLSQEQQREIEEATRIATAKAPGGANYEVKVEGFVQDGEFHLATISQRRTTRTYIVPETNQVYRLAEQDGLFDVFNVEVMSRTLEPYDPRLR
jgi:hypothetical protein